MNRVKQIANIAVFGILILVLTFLLWLGEDKEKSISERRNLRQLEQIMDVEARDEADKDLPFEEFVEKYLLDQFPMRDDFRRIKAFLYLDVFKKNDNNDIYKYDDTIIKIEDELSKESVAYVVDVSNSVIERFFSNNENVYFSIIPDKHYYASKQNGYPSMDYETLFTVMKNGFVNAKYIDVTDKISLSDYYKTDSHWSQDKIVDVAESVLSVMKKENFAFGQDFFNIQTKSPFYGVYYGHSALSLEPDDIKYLTNDVTDGMTMTYFDELGKPVQNSPVYVTEKFSDKDPYDMFLAGATPIAIIDNPNVASDKELVLFRDSFGSSIAPLLACEYKKTYVIDLRYIVPDMLPSVCKFNKNQDVLFMYSTGLINAAKGIMNDFMMK